MRITVVNNVSLDGVVQAPAAPDEDRRGGFEHGGWGVPYMDQVVGEYLGNRMGGAPGAMILGRYTYKDLYDAWHGRDDNPYSTVLERNTKYVVSNSLREPLVWANSTVLRGDGVAAVRELTRTTDLDATILGSAQLVRSLLRAGLVDELVLTIIPITLGRGHRLFPDDGPLTRFTLLDTKPSTTGVIIAHYRHDP
jgi:dihydrofolate reductase